MHTLEGHDQSSTGMTWSGESASLSNNSSGVTTVSTQSFYTQPPQQQQEELAQPDRPSRGENGMPPRPEDSQQQVRFAAAGNRKPGGIWFAPLPPWPPPPSRHGHLIHPPPSLFAPAGVHAEAWGKRRRAWSPSTAGRYGRGVAVASTNPPGPTPSAGLALGHGGHGQRGGQQPRQQPHARGRGLDNAAAQPPQGTYGICISQRFEVNVFARGTRPFLCFPMMYIPSNLSPHPLTYSSTPPHRSTTTVAGTASAPRSRPGATPALGVLRSGPGCRRRTTH